MADAEQLKVFKQGFDAWDKWMKENAPVKVDLSEVELFELTPAVNFFKKTNLSEANFSRVTVYDGDFSENDLSEANLSEATFSAVNFGKANLSRADLSGADLSGYTESLPRQIDGIYKRTDLSGANLSGAVLSGTDFEGAILRRANLAGAIISQTHFADCDLRFATVIYDALDRFPQDIREKYELTWTIIDAPEPVITRTLTFTHEHYQAGLSILSYFHTILHDRYPEAAPKVAIKQEGLTITLIIETEDGLRDRYERTLDQYGEVLKQRMRDDDLLNNQVQVLELRNQLRFANAQYESQQELLRATRQQLDERNKNFEQLVYFIGSHIQSEKATALPPINVNVTNQLHSTPSVSAELTAGDRLSGQARKLLEAPPTPATLLELLGLVKEEVQALELPEEKKKELKHEVEGAEIQAKKTVPKPQNIIEKLKKATEVLNESGNLAGKAVMIGTMLNKAIDWVSQVPIP